MNDRYCKPCRERGRISRAQKSVNGELMCLDCWSGKSPEDEAARGGSKKARMQNRALVDLSDLQQAFEAMCPACRRRVIAALLEKLAARPGAIVRELADLRKEIAESVGIDERALCARSNAPRLVEARREFCRKARKRGFSLTEIGGAIRRHHTSVMYLVRGRNA